MPPMALTLARTTAVKTTLVVGVDFGTTFSGVSWLICRPGSPPGQPEVVSLWPTSTDNRRKNSDSQKVPTKMHYDENGELSWGFKIPAGVETIEWFKLLLLNDADLKEYLQDSSHLHDAKKYLSKLGKTAVQLIGDYLKVLWDHALNQIRNAKGQALIDGMPFEVVVTVPAIWTDDARCRMYEAAGLAGILNDRIAGKTTLSFISEPEAAAIATMPELENRGDLQVGDSFIVLDAGGGTVDIISYKINKLEPLSISECALCGGTFLDKEFESLLKHVIGEVSWNKMNKPDIRRMMNNEWEHGIKEAFNGEPDYYTVELPSRAQRAPLEFSSYELRPIFDKIVSQISRLTQKQIDAIVEKTLRLPGLVILVGGFGRSPYILQHLKTKLDGRITVLQARGDKPWTAICRGAALSRAAEMSSTTGDGQSLLQSRIARLNYGWEYEAVFVDGVHDPRDRYWHDLLGEWYARNQIEWVVKRGDDISLKKAETYNYNLFWPDNTKGWGDCAIEVYACGDFVPPSRKRRGVRHIASVNFRTPKPVECFERECNKSGSFYRQWSLEYKVVVSGASFNIFLASDGKEKELGKISVDAK